MNQEQFQKVLEANGFPDSVLVVREASAYLEDHAHHFEVMALVLSGQIDLMVAGVRSTYLVGDIFHLSPNQMHAEWYGSGSVQYLAGRKELL